MERIPNAFELTADFHLVTSEDHVSQNAAI